MNTRVRYTQINGILTSPAYLANNDLATATIIPSELKYSIIHGGTVYHGQGKDIPSIKKIIKLRLKDLGVPFSDEVRPNKRKKLKKLVSDLTCDVRWDKNHGVD